MRPGRTLVLAAALLAAPGCTEPSSDFSGLELLLVTDALDLTLSIVPVGNRFPRAELRLGHLVGFGLSARSGVALVPLGTHDAVAVIDVRAARVLRVIDLPPRSGATGSAIVDDSIAYVGNPGRNSVSRVNYLAGATSEVLVGVRPHRLAYAAGLVFVVNANPRDTALGSPSKPGWISVVDPATNALAAGIDSIPLEGSNPRAVTVGPSELVYVGGTYTDDSTFSYGRLWVIDPRTRAVVSTYTDMPMENSIAADALGRIFIASDDGAVMFDLKTGTPRPMNTDGGNRAVAVDSRNQIYVVYTFGFCIGDEQSTADVYDPSLNKVATIEGLRSCPRDAVVTRVPAD